jgi:hypothetical protein
VLRKLADPLALADMPTAPRPSPLLPLQLPPASSAPSAWRKQHGQVETPQIDSQTFRPYWRVRSQLDKLLSQGAITARERQTADAFRRLYELAHRGELAAQAWDKTYLDADCRRLGDGDQSRQRLGAARRLARLRGELGEVAFGLVVAVVVEDACWAKIGRRFRVDPKTGRSWALQALQALATL